MNKEIKLGIMYNEGEGPDFGTIQQHVLNPNNLYLLARDIPKLNGMLTRATSAAYLPEGQSFNFYTGALAYVVDYKTAGTGKIYMYHRGKDHWYEFNIRSDLGLCELMWNRHETILRKTKTISGTPPLSFESNGRPLKNYRIYGNTVNGESVGNLVTEGEHAGEYCVPVTISNGSNTQTTNIYIPEQIRKVGDEFEYIDFKEQKQYKLRKNLWNENYNRTITDNTIKYVPIFVGDGEFTCSTTAPKQTGDIDSNNSRYVFLLSGNVNTGAKNALNGVSLNDPKTVTAENGYITVAYRYIESHNVYPWNYQTQIEKGSIATAYEPYIQNTELDITIPFMSTIKGINTLSIETTVQPSSIEIVGIINKTIIN